MVQNLATSHHCTLVVYHRILRELGSMCTKIIHLMQVCCDRVVDKPSILRNVQA